MLLKSGNPTDFLCALGETNVKKGILFLFMETFATFKRTKCDRILEKIKKRRGINTAALRFSPPFDSGDKVNTH